MTAGQKDKADMITLNREGIGMTSLRTRERLVNRLIEQGIQRIDVLESIRTTPRHLFIDEALSHRAYEDVALPIGFNQTISQPYIVARMTETILNAAPDDATILEIGTGCGYQTAILAQHVKHVYSIERIRPLLDRTRQRLRDLGVNNVRVIPVGGREQQELKLYRKIDGKISDETLEAVRFVPLLGGVEN
jgi:protein-L-isoaspartate(D-aspartate) O-methyltransferase